MGIYEVCLFKHQRKATLPLTVVAELRSETLASSTVLYRHGGGNHAATEYWNGDTAYRVFYHAESKDAS